MSDEIKAGARNNSGDRDRIRGIRKLANDIVGHTLEMEPNDNDPQPDQWQGAMNIESEKAIVIYGGAVKALGNGRVGGYLVQFGDESKTDLTGEYFSALTDFGEYETAPVYYQHGLDPALKLRRLGKADLRKDDFGVWAETQLSLRDDYEKFIYGMVEAGKMGWSSGTAAHLVEREPMDHAVLLKSWPLGLDASLTPTPAEPRNSAVPLKSIQPIAVLPEAQPQDGGPSNAGAAEREPAQVKSIGETKMTDNIVTETPEYKALNDKVDALSDNINRLLKQMEDAPAVRKSGYYSVDGGAADQNVKSFGDYLMAIARHDVKRLASVYGSTKANDLTTDAGELGGYTVPTAYYSELLKVATEASPILSRIQRIPVTAQAGEYPALDQYVAPTAGAGNSAFAAGVTTAKTAEGGTLTETNPTFEMIKYRLHKIGGYTQVTKELMADNAVGIEALLRDLFGVAIRAKEEYYVLKGNGVGEPLGVFNSPCIIDVTTASDNAFAFADAGAMLARFKSVGGSPMWVTHPSVIPDLIAITVASGNPNTLVDSPRASLATLNLLGYPIAYSEHMDQANYDDVLLADWNAYKFWVKGGLEIAYSEHFAFTSELGTWRFSERLDGQPWLKGKITLADAQGSYTVSPFVYHND